MPLPFAKTILVASMILAVASLDEASARKAGNQPSSSQKSTLSKSPDKGGSGLRDDASEVKARTAKKPTKNTAAKLSSQKWQPSNVIHSRPSSSTKRAKTP